MSRPAGDTKMAGGADPAGGPGHMSKSSEEHRHTAAERVGSVSVAVVVVSDHRTPETDEAGPAIERLVREAGHTVAFRTLVPNSVTEIQHALDEGLAVADCVIFSGGTGLGRRDLTVGVVHPRFDVVLPGFGELFRSLSYQDIGPAAMLSRAEAGLIQGRLVVLLPGSVQAAGLALTKLILPELSHLVWEVRRE